MKKYSSKAKITISTETVSRYEVDTTTFKKSYNRW